MYATGAGAVGLAAAASTHGMHAGRMVNSIGSTCTGGVFSAVQTKESSSEYGIERIPIVVPGRETPMGAFKNHLHRQLDTLVGKHILGSLKVLGGMKNRLEVGAASSIRSSCALILFVDVTCTAER